jgi:methyl-accepting chemotaxis protein
VQQIAAFSKQQAQLAAELKGSVTQLNQGSSATVSAISKQTHSTQTLVQSSGKLIQAVSQFRLPQPA